jgi:hypothetical protein
VLAELQPSFIKVDMSIVRGVDADPRKQRLINLLCRFADALAFAGAADGEAAARAACEQLRAAVAAASAGAAFVPRAWLGEGPGLGWFGADSPAPDAGALEMPPLDVRAPPPAPLAPMGLVPITKDARPESARHAIVGRQ